MEAVDLAHALKANGDEFPFATIAGGAWSLLTPEQKVMLVETLLSK